MDTFAFLVHPQSLEDIYRVCGIARHLPPGLTQSLIKNLPPLKLADIRGIRSPLAEVQGFFMSVMLTPQQILQLPAGWVTRKIIRAGRKADKLGARIMGLGAYTSVAGDGGITVAKNLNIPLTTGNSLTAAAAIASIPPAAELMEIDLKNARLAVTATGRRGCPGMVIVRAAVRMLAGQISRIQLVGLDEGSLQRAAREIGDDTGSVDIASSAQVGPALSQADIVLVAAGASEMLIHPEDLKPGAVVCDIARPRETAEMVTRERDDVLAIDGGLWEIPGDVRSELDLGIPGHLAYSCIAETMVLALEGRFENYSLGKDLDHQKIVEIYQLALKHGFRLKALRAGEGTLDPSRAALIKAKARNRQLK